MTVTERMLRGQDRGDRRCPRNPLDILGSADRRRQRAGRDLGVEEWFETVRRSAPVRRRSPASAYERDPRPARGASFPSDEFAAAETPRMVWDRDAGTLTGRPGARAHRRHQRRHDPRPRPVRGVSDRLRATTRGPRAGAASASSTRRWSTSPASGDVFTLGTTSWRIADITHDRVQRHPRRTGSRESCRSGMATAIGRPFELGEALGAFSSRGLLRLTRRRLARAVSSSAGLDEQCAPRTSWPI